MRLHNPGVKKKTTLLMSSLRTHTSIQIQCKISTANYTFNKCLTNVCSDCCDRTFKFETCLKTNGLEIAICNEMMESNELKKAPIELKLPFADTSQWSCPLTEMC